MNLYCSNPNLERQIDRLLPIAALLRDPRVQEVSIDSGGKVYADYGEDGLRDTGLRVAHLARRAAIRLVTAAHGGYLDAEAPFATVILSCGARFHGALSPVADEAQISIRTHRRILRPLSEFMSARLIAVVREVIAARKSLVVGGATAAGKTTLLNSLIALIPADQKLVIIEDAAELQIAANRHVVRRLATDRANLRRHVFESLRDQPDWLICGEVRDHSARDMLDAARTGHPGMSSVHASSAEGVITRLMSLAECDRAFVREAIALVLFIQRLPDGRRAVTQIREVE